MGWENNIPQGIFQLTAWDIRARSTALKRVEHRIFLLSFQYPTSNRISNEPCPLQKSFCGCTISFRATFNSVQIAKEGIIRCFSLQYPQWILNAPRVSLVWNARECLTLPIGGCLAALHWRKRCTTIICYRCDCVQCYVVWLYLNLCSYIIKLPPKSLV